MILRIERMGKHQCNDNNHRVKLSMVVVRDFVHIQTVSHYIQMITTISHR